jgi:hypothetical protein
MLWLHETAAIRLKVSEIYKKEIMYDFIFSINIIIILYVYILYMKGK